MARRKRRKYRRRKKLFSFKPKQETVYTLVAIGLFAAASIIFFSLRDDQSPLALVRINLVEYIGWGIILLPIILISIGLLLLKLKFSLTRPNVTIGLIITSIAIIGLTKAGRIGVDIFSNIASFISGIGAFFLLLLFTIAGLMILFNTSLDKIIIITIDALDYFKGLFSTGFISDVKNVFEQKESAFDKATANLTIKSGNEEAQIASPQGQTVPETLEPSKIPAIPQAMAIDPTDRKSVVKGKSVDLGGRRIIKKIISFFLKNC